MLAEIPNVDEHQHFTTVTIFGSSRKLRFSFRFVSVRNFCFVSSFCFELEKRKRTKSSKSLFMLREANLIGCWLVTSFAPFFQHKGLRIPFDGIFDAYIFSIMFDVKNSKLLSSIIKEGLVKYFMSICIKNDT